MATSAPAPSCCDLLTTSQVVEPRLAASGSLLLSLPLGTYAMAAAPSLTWGGTALWRKAELHVTLLATEAANTCRDAGVDVVGLARRFQWRISRPGDGALLAEDDGEQRRSLVEWIKLPDFDVFRERVATAAGTRLPGTLPHITQYASTPRGIGLPDMATITRLRKADLRLPGIGERPPPRRPLVELRKDYQDGCTLLPPDLALQLGEHGQAVDAWLDHNDARSATILSAADPFGQQAHAGGNRLRHALLQSVLEREGIRALTVPGREDDDTRFDATWCLLDVEPARLDALLRAWEQFAAIRVTHGQPVELVAHPGLRD
ncbi:MAG: DUF3293 domain-containing protein [Pseudoxanthomonas suwonensis]|nr:DUF3293 domain-containing protein [Pseudoxanthomonas suwonensis]